MLYALVVTTEPADHIVRLRLLNEHGGQLAANCEPEVLMPRLAFPKRHKYTDVRSREYLTEAESAVFQ